MLSTYSGTGLGIQRSVRTDSVTIFMKLTALMGEADINQIIIQINVKL